MPTIQEQLEELSHVIKTSQALIPSIQSFLPVIIDTIKSGGCIFTCGNGGSATDALHLTEELVGKYNKPRQAIRSLCLCADVATLTCIANDWDYASVFSRQIEAHGHKGDTLIVFTTSGKSENIIRALHAARERGVHTIAFLGKDGGACKDLADHNIIIPSQNTARIQELHTWLLHVILETVEAEFVEKKVNL